MDDVKKLNGWMIVSGVALIIVGLLCVFWRTQTLSTLALLVGIGFLFAGVTNIISYFSYKNMVVFPGWMILEIIIDILLGVLFVIHPFAGATVVVWMVVLGIVIVGIIQFIEAFSSKRAGLKEWWIGFVGGLFSILFAILMVLYPGLLAIMIGIYAIVAGCMLIGTGAMFSRAFR